MNLPTRHNVVKLPFIPWEEYSISLSTLDKQRLSNPHHTRAITLQNPGKGMIFFMKASLMTELLKIILDTSHIFTNLDNGFALLALDTLRVKEVYFITFSYKPVSKIEKIIVKEI